MVNWLWPKIEKKGQNISPVRTLLDFVPEFIGAHLYNRGTGSRKVAKYSVDLFSAMSNHSAESRTPLTFGTGHSWQVGQETRDVTSRQTDALVPRWQGVPGAADGVRSGHAKPRR